MSDDKSFRTGYRLASTFRGRRQADGSEVVVECGGITTRLRPLGKWHRGFNGEFRWDVPGINRQQLAQALLMAVLDNADLAVLYETQFQEEMLASLDPDGWTLTGRQIAEWVVTVWKRDIGLTEGGAS